MRDNSHRCAGNPPRVLDAELLHVTLYFLGNRPTEEIETVARRLAAIVGVLASELSVGAPLWLPPRRPNALAVELHDHQGRLASLRESVVSAVRDPDEPRLAAEGHPSRHAGHRRFRPHITLVRMRPDTVPRERTMPPTPALSFVAGELVLYRSWLAPKGASYEVLAAHPIG